MRQTSYEASEARAFLKQVDHDPSDYPEVRRLDIDAVAPVACASCPWRRENQEDPPKDRPEEWFTAETRERIWFEDGVGEGADMFCHCFKTAEEDSVVKARPCPGSAALQQRAAIRWLDGKPTQFHARSFAAAFPQYSEQDLLAAAPLKIIAEMLGLTFKKLELFSAAITREEVIASAHPLVFDPKIASEQVPAPTDAEIAEWRAAAKAFQTMSGYPSEAA